MNEPDATAVWKLFRFNWFLIAGIYLAFGLGLLLTNFEVKPQGYLIVFLIAGIYGVFGYTNAISPRRRHPRIFATLTAIAQMTLVVFGDGVGHLYCDVGELAVAGCEVAGVRSRAGVRFLQLPELRQRPVMGHLHFVAGYRVIFWPIWLIVVALPLAGHYTRTGQFICAFALALIAATCISTLVPAIGVYGAMGLTASDFPNIIPQGYYDTLHDAPLLRGGSLRTLDLFHLNGVLTFPSFHAASAILYGWALWPIRWFRPVNLLCNGAMIFATPIGGGHFFVDVTAGIVVAIASIHAARGISGNLAIRASREMVPLSWASAAEA